MERNPSDGLRSSQRRLVHYRVSGADHCGWGADDAPDRCCNATPKESVGTVDESSWRPLPPFCPQPLRIDQTLGTGGKGHMGNGAPWGVPMGRGGGRQPTHWQPKLRPPPSRKDNAVSLRGPSLGCRRATTKSLRPNDLEPKTLTLNHIWS